MIPNFDLLPPDSVARPWWRLLTRGEWFVFSVAMLAWLFDCFDQQIFNVTRDGAMEALVPQKKLAIEYGPYTTSSFLVGWAIGGLIFGALGDRFGRAKVLSWTILIYSISTGLSSFSTGFADFCFYRLITGLGVGGVFGLAVALVADALPDRARARARLASTGRHGRQLGRRLDRHGDRKICGRASPALWLGTLASDVSGRRLPALLSVFVMRRVREPNRWVSARAAGIESGVKFGSYRHLLGHPIWSRRAWLGLIACSAGIVGLWGIGNFHPKIVGTIVAQHFASAGLTSEAMADEIAYWRSAGVLLQNLGGFWGMLCLAKLAQTWGRRPAFGLALALSFLSTVLVFKSMQSMSDLYWMLPIMGFGQLSVFGVIAVYLPELFPTSLRSTGTSFCYNVGRLVAATAPFTLSQITKRLGSEIEGFRTAGIWMSVVLLVGIAVLPFLPETKGQPLPEE